MWWSLTKSHQVLYRQAVSEALFDNCEDYQNIQNSSCKVGAISSMDIIFTIAVESITHQHLKHGHHHHCCWHHHSSTSPIQQLTRVSRCGVLTNLSNWTATLTETPETELPGHKPKSGEHMMCRMSYKLVAKVLLRSIPNITHLQLLLPTGQSPLLWYFYLFMISCWTRVLRLNCICTMALGTIAYIQLVHVQLLFQSSKNIRSPGIIYAYAYERHVVVTLKTL